MKNKAKPQKKLMNEAADKLACIIYSQLVDNTDDDSEQNIKYNDRKE